MRGGSGPRQVWCELRTELRASNPYRPVPRIDYPQAPEMRANLLPRLGELLLEAKEHDRALLSGVDAEPTGVNMDRVASTMRTIDQLGEGRLAPSAGVDSISLRLNVDLSANVPPWNQHAGEACPWRPALQCTRPFAVPRREVHPGHSPDK